MFVLVSYFRPDSEALFIIGNRPFITDILPVTRLVDFTIITNYAASYLRDKHVITYFSDLQTL